MGNCRRTRGRGGEEEAAKYLLLLQSSRAFDDQVSSAIKALLSCASEGIKERLSASLCGAFSLFIGEMRWKAATQFTSSTLILDLEARDFTLR